MDAYTRQQVLSYLGIDDPRTLEKRWRNAGYPEPPAGVSGRNPRYPYDLVEALRLAHSPEARSPHEERDAAQASLDKLTAEAADLDALLLEIDR